MADELATMRAMQPPRPICPRCSSPLLKGVIYRDDDAAHWSALLQLQARVRDHVAVLGLELMLDEAEGYAFLRSRPEPEDDRRAQAAAPGGTPAAVLPGEPAAGAAAQEAGRVRRRWRRHAPDPVARARSSSWCACSCPTGSNEARLIDQVDTHLNKVVELGLRALALRGPATAMIRGAAHPQGLCRRAVAGGVRGAAGGVPRHTLQGRAEDSRDE